MSLKHSLALAVGMAACTPHFETVEGNDPVMHTAAKKCPQENGQPATGEQKYILDQVTKCLDKNGNGKIDTIIEGRPNIEAWRLSATEEVQQKMGSEATTLLSE